LVPTSGSDYDICSLPCQAPRIREEEEEKKRCCIIPNGERERKVEDIDNNNTNELQGLCSQERRGLAATPTFNHDHHRIMKD
jgi:hypothetical protein